MRDFSVYNREQINQLINNYEEKGRVGTAEYAELLRQRERHRAGEHELDIHKSLALLKEKARRPAFCSYGELAEASGVAWSHTVRARMSGKGSHLDRLLDFCRHDGLPPLTALVVNKDNLATGALDEFALSGFVASARGVGEEVADERAFLRTCQDACFAWGRTIAD